MNSKKILSVVFCVIFVMSLTGCKFSTSTQEQPARQHDASVPRKMSVVPQSILSPEMEQQRQASHQYTVVIANNGSGTAYIEPYNGKYRVVHNGKPGKLYLGISELILSSDGSRVAYVGAVRQNVNKIILDNRERLEFGADDNHWFTPDGKHISTVTKDGHKFIVVEKNVHYEQQIEGSPVLGSDSKTIAFVMRATDGVRTQFVVSDLDLKNRTLLEMCGAFILPNDDSTRIAVGCSVGGKHSIKVMDLQKRSVISEHTYEGVITHLKFSPYNDTLVYTYESDKGERYVAYNDKREKIPAGDEFMTDPLVLSDPEYVGVVIGDAFKHRFYRAFQKQQKNGKIYGFVSDLVSSRDGRNYAYIATDIGASQMHIVVNGHEGSTFDKIVSPVFSPDGRFLVYRARHEGRRFMVVMDTKGTIVSRHRDYSMVFQPNFVNAGKSVAYGVLDGNELWWKVEKLEGK